MRSLLNPIVRNYAGTISATNASINYAARNIVHPFLKKRIQGTANSQVITIPFASSQSADCLFYGVHNLSSLVAVFKNSGGSTIGTVTISSPGTNDVNAEYFTQIDNISSIEVTITTASTYVKLGGFDCGIYTDIPYSINAWPIRTIDNSIFDESLGGQMSTDNIQKRRGYAFTIREVEKGTAEIIRAAYNDNGLRPTYIDITPNDKTYIASIYGRMVMTELSKENRRFSFDIEIQEAF